MKMRFNAFEWLEDTEVSDGAGTRVISGSEVDDCGSTAVVPVCETCTRGIMCWLGEGMGDVLMVDVLMG